MMLTDHERGAMLKAGMTGKEIEAVDAVVIAGNLILSLPTLSSKDADHAIRDIENLQNRLMSRPVLRLMAEKRKSKKDATPQTT